MNSVVVSAKTLDEAITNALLQLGASSDQVNIEVLEEGSKGFMGLLRKDAKVRATLKEGEEPVIASSEPLSSASVEEVQEETAKQPVEAVTVTGEKVVIDDTIEQRLRKVNSERETKAAGQGRNERAQDKPAYAAPVYEIPADAEVVQQKVKDFLQEVLSAMGIESSITTQFSKEGILEVGIEGEGMGVIIGKRGSTLDSLQYLATLVVNKGRNDHVRIKLDTEGYRARRQETLEKLAINLAKKVKRTGHRVVLEPMNPYERRIIHSVLQADRSVETHSDGEEPYRKVIISLRKRH
ncbi:MAG: protein jag [Lachnospiraceae bacterium]|jgi:spoIIIJ-associated protein|nr:protein jag [Lachnospiraceae bacterium]